MNKTKFIGKEIGSVVEDGRTIIITLKEKSSEYAEMKEFLKNYSIHQASLKDKPADDNIVDGMAVNGLMRWDFYSSNCTTCLGHHNCNGHHNGKGRCHLIGYRYYANKTETEALIAEWDQRYIDGGGLFVCEKKDECEKKGCEGQMPHKYHSDCSEECRHPLRGKCIPYRGERPAPEEYNRISADVSVTIKDTQYLSSDDMSRRTMFITGERPAPEEESVATPEFCCVNYNMALQECEDCPNKSFDIRRWTTKDCQSIYGFSLGVPAEDTTEDPTVSLGDKFKNHEGTWMAVNSFPEYMHLVLIEKASEGNLIVTIGLSEGKSVPFYDQNLSDLIGKDLLEEFKKVQNG